MKNLILIALVVCFGSCSNQKPSTETANVPVKAEGSPTNLVPEDGLRLITGNYYHLVLKQKKIRPKNFFITRDTVIVSGKEDNYAYSVIEILVDTPTEFKAKIRGGHTELDTTPKDFEISVQGGIIKTTKLENGASWIEVSNDKLIVDAFESELDKQGFIFHR
jgi:hypothetical protein